MGWGDVLGGVGDFFGAKAGEEAAKDAAKMEQTMTREQVKRMEEQNIRDLSQLDVLQYAGGFAGDSVTNQIYKREFERLQQEEVDWLKLVGQSRYDAQKATAKAYKFGQYAAIGKVVGGAAGISLPSSTGGGGGGSGVTYGDFSGWSG